MFNFIVGFVAGTVFGPAAFVLLKKLRQQLKERVSSKQED